MRSFKTYFTEGLEPVGDRLGSNPGGVHKDENGDHHYVKYYQNPDQGKVEVLTSHIYEHMGIKTAQPRLLNIGGKEAVVSRWNPHLEQMHHDEFTRLNTHQHQDLGRMYHGAILTKNWDVVGLVHDNILRHKESGDLHSIDHGGAFHFRARGGPKEYGPDINEHHTLRHNDEASGQVFHHVLTKDPEAEKAGHRATAGIDLSHTKRLFKESGLRNWEDMHKTFTARRDALLKKY